MKTKSGNPFFTKSWTANFTANVLGVIIGIALTFGITFLIQQHSEKKQIHELMVLLRQEIADNKATFEGIQEDYLQTKKAYGIFLSDEWKTMPNDTLREYVFYGRRITSYILLNSAWNVFQNSNVIQNFDQKKLIVAISSLYKQMEAQNKLWEDFLKRKTEVFNIYMDDADKRSYVNDMLKDDPSLLFMKDTYYATTYENVFTSIIDFADYTLYMIDSSDNYQSDLNSIAKDFNAFREKKHMESKVK